MSFLNINTHTNKKISKKINIRKEHGSFLAHRSKQISHNLLERASAFTSKGSLTLEAALAAPIFFFGIISLVYLLEMAAIQTVMKSALYEVGRGLAKDAYVNPIIIPEKMEREIVNCIGEERLNRSIVAGGSRGIDCSKSIIFWNTSIMELSLRYRLKIPVLMFRLPMLLCEEKVRVKGWTGYAGSGFGNPHEDIVFITETGVVYHRDKNCTYLELSIQSVNRNETSDLRNEDGGKYYPCEYCMHGSRENVFITATGNRYHDSVSCIKLKRSVYAVPLSEVYGRGGCSRCVK